MASIRSSQVRKRKAKINYRILLRGVKNFLTSPYPTKDGALSS